MLYCWLLIPSRNKSSYLHSTCRKSYIDVHNHYMCSFSNEVEIEMKSDLHGNFIHCSSTNPLCCCPTRYFRQHCQTISLSLMSTFDLFTMIVTFMKQTTLDLWKSNKEKTFLFEYKNKRNIEIDILPFPAQKTSHVNLTVTCCAVLKSSCRDRVDSISKIRMD